MKLRDFERKPVSIDGVVGTIVLGEFVDRKPGAYFIYDAFRGTRATCYSGGGWKLCKSLRAHLIDGTHIHTGNGNGENGILRYRKRGLHSRKKYSISEDSYRPEEQEKYNLINNALEIAEAFRGKK